MSKQKGCIYITVVFLIFISAFFIVNLLTPDKRFSEMENRNLAQMPELSIDGILSGEFSQDFETYITDQFLGRDFLIQLKSTVEVMLGKQENSEVYYGKNQTLIENLKPIDETLLSENIDAINLLIAQFDLTQSQISQLKIPVYFALIPTSAAIWEERLPKGAPNYQQNEKIEEIYNKIECETVDIYGALETRATEELYYRTDHHWTSLGAYYGYVAFIEKTGEQAKDINSYQKEVVTEKFFGTMYSKVGAWWIEPDQIDSYVPQEVVLVTKVEGSQIIESQMYHTDFLAKKDKYSYFMGGNQPLSVVENLKNRGKENLLIIRDSYMDSQLPFLTEHYGQIHLVDLRFYKGDIVEYARENEIDVVLISYGLQNFARDRNLRFMSQYDDF